MVQQVQLEVQARGYQVAQAVREELQDKITDYQVAVAVLVAELEVEEQMAVPEAVVEVKELQVTAVRVVQEGVLEVAALALGVPTALTLR